MARRRLFEFLVLRFPLLLLCCGSCCCARSSEMADVLQRPIRATTYPSNSNLGIFFALAVPLEDPVNSVSLSYFFEANYGLPSNSSNFFAEDRGKRSIDRSTVYAVLQSKFRRAGFPGRECLLLAICEASEHSLEDNGLLGDVFRIVFTPSTSRPEDELPDGVIEAELNGLNGTCSHYRASCPLSLFDMIGIVN